MNNVKIKMSYEIWGTKFKSEKSYKIDNINILYNLVSSDYETLLYLENKADIYCYELQFKVNNNDWEYFNNYDYCKYLKDKYFINNDNITDYSLLNKLDDMKFTNFLFYVRGLRDNNEK